VLREIRLGGFKCFEAATLQCRRLTLLSGANGGGKSTALQSLLLIHQALQSSQGGGALATIPLNGPVISLGTVRDVVNQSQGGPFSIGVSWLGTPVTWKFSGGDLAAEISAVEWGPPTELVHSEIRTLFPPKLMAIAAAAQLHGALKSLKYVPADRVGPVETYPRQEDLRQTSLGPRAERAVGALYDRDPTLPPPAFRHPDLSYPNTFTRQVHAWFADVFPGATLEVLPVTNANLVTLGLRTKDATAFHRPQHVGFGMTYALPLMVALLSAQPGDLILVENPEAHLHPRAQQRVTELCVRAADAGIQVLVETHSDHVMNGVRVAVHRGRIKPEDVAMLYFEATNDQASVRLVEVDARGRFSGRPKGFFDEGERQLSALLGDDGSEA